jgi:hypothetical protein
MQMGQTPIINLLPSTKIICEGTSNSLWGIQYCSSTSAASTHGLTACLVMNPGDGFGNWIVSPRGEAIGFQKTEWKYLAMHATCPLPRVCCCGDTQFKCDPSVSGMTTVSIGACY